jgi:delta 1-pyrroline-5-carboxylate dehydrogenase
LSPNLGRAASPICPDLIYDRHIEQTVTINTAAAGGNAALMAQT